MLAVLKLNEPSTFVLLRPEDNLSHWSTLSTNALFFTLQTTANVATRHDLVAWLVTSWSVTHLTALLGTNVMRTLPRAFLAARCTWLSTIFRASTVDAQALTLRGTRRARLSTPRLARMGTD